MKFEDLIEILRENELKANDLDIITRAYNKAKNFSDDMHYLRVAGIVAELNADTNMIVSALLHDAVMDGDLSLDEVREEFGDNIADLIDNLVKLRRIKLNDYNESSSIYLRKVLVGISEDVRVLIIKLADRLDEMRNVEGMSEEDKKQIANETMNVLIPIAHRLGINSIKSELENLCLLFTKPDVYNDILEKLDCTREELADSLDEMQNSIMEILTEHGINFKIKSRVKSVYSIYNKLTTGKKWSDIYDILAMRLILPTKDDCYLAVGLIHAKYRPIPKRFKDYIAMPKENMYQSLHTSVFGVDGHIFEIQLRTKEMDEIAEHGIASHWSYKEHGTKVAQNLMEQKLAIFRSTIDLAKSETNDELFVKSMESELLSKLIYVFTPKGDVMELPLGATPVDFAYRIHSDIGDHMVSAIVNDNIVPLNYELQDGDIIKINTNKTSKPNLDWLDFVKTPQAKSKIKSYFSKKDREDYIEQGKMLLEKEVKKQHLNYNELFTPDKINKILNDLKLKEEDDLYLSIGSLRYTAYYIISLVNEDKRDIQDIMLDRVNRRNNIKDNYKNDVIVAGTDNILASLAKCCNPIPGDKIIGYITKGEGVSVHKIDCPNVRGLTTRLIDVKWNNAKDKLFVANLVIKTNSSQNHILDIVTKASTRNVSLNGINEVNMGEYIDYHISVKVESVNELGLFIDELKTLSYVMEIIR